MGTLRLHTVRCSNRAELSSWSLEEVSHRRAPRYAASLVLLDLPPARRNQRDESITGDLSALRGLLVPQLQAPLSVASGMRWSCHGFPQCLSQTNLLDGRLVLGLRHHSVFVLLAGLMQVGLVAVKGHRKVGHVVGITNTGFLDQAECKVSVISWHSGRLARVARSSTAAELQAAADAEGKLTYICLPFWEIFGGAAPLKKWKDVAGQVPATLVLDSRGAYDALERSGSSCLGLEDRRSGVEAPGVEEVNGQDTMYVTLDTFSSTTGRLHDQRI